MLIILILLYPFEFLFVTFAVFNDCIDLKSLYVYIKNFNSPLIAFLFALHFLSFPWFPSHFLFSRNCSIVIDSQFQDAPLL